MIKHNKTKLYTLRDAADEIGTSYWKVYRAITSDKVSPLRSGSIRLLTEKKVGRTKDSD